MSIQQEVYGMRGGALSQVLQELDALITERDFLRAELEALKAKQYNNRPKLGRGEVARIHEMRRAGYKLQEIADSFDVNKTTVSRIVRGEYHK